MDVPVWGLLILAASLGFLAAAVAQFTPTKQWLETDAKAEALGKNIKALIQRNSDRRKDLRRRQDLLDCFTKLDIKHREGQLDDDALKKGIKRVEERIAALTKVILESENLITENTQKLADLKLELSGFKWWLALASILLGAATAATFGFLGVLGSEANPKVITDDVPITTYVFVQSLLLGAGWPVVWSRFTRPEKIEAAATAALDVFETSIRGVETLERKEV